MKLVKRAKKAFSFLISLFLIPVYFVLCILEINSDDEEGEGPEADGTYANSGGDYNTKR